MSRLLVVFILFIIIAIPLFFIIKPSRLKKPVLKNEICEETLNHEGRVRSYTYYIPDQIHENPSLVIALHRARSNGSDLRETMNYRYEELADKYKFIVLYPDGYEGNWNDCRKAPNDSAHKLNINDTGFISTLIDLFIKKYSINKNHIYVTGFSAGGHMTLKLAASIPDKISKFAPALTQMPVPDNYNCEEIKKPVSILLINGTTDPISPFNGGEVSIMKFIKQGKVLSVSETVNYFLKLNNLVKKPVVTDIPSSNNDPDFRIEKKVWLEENKSSLYQFIIYGGGHTLPGTNPLPSIIFGKTFKDYLIADEIIKFFLQ